MFIYLFLIIIFYNEKAKVTVGIDSVAQRQKYKTKKINKVYVPDTYLTVKHTPP